MPITPLHLGPAFALRAAFGVRIGLLGFVVSQVLLDMEPGLKLFGFIPEGRGLHEGHTWLLAPAFIGAAWLIAAAGQRLLRTNIPRLLLVERRLGWLRSGVAAEGMGAALGVVSHLLLDAFYHRDVGANVGLPGASGVIAPQTIDLCLLLFLPVSVIWLWRRTVAH